MSITPHTPALSESEQIARFTQQFQWAELKIRVLEEQLRLERIKKYGPASEKLNDAQLALLELKPGVSHAEVQAESEREPLHTPPPATTTKKEEERKHPGRQKLPAGLPRPVDPCNWKLRRGSKMFNISVADKCRLWGPISRVR